MQIAGSMTSWLLHSKSLIDVYKRQNLSCALVMKGIRRIKVIPRMIEGVLFMVYVVSFSLVRHRFGQAGERKLARQG